MTNLWDSLPVWLRWILFIPFSILIGITAGLLVSIINGIWPEAEFIDRAVRFSAISFATIFCLTYTAPKGGLYFGLAYFAIRLSVFAIFAARGILAVTRAEAAELTWRTYYSPALTELIVCLVSAALIWQLRKDLA